MARIAILSPSHAELKNSYLKSTLDLNPAVNNFGNLMFRHAVSMHVGQFERIQEDADPSEVREKYDLIVMPLANLLHPWANGWQSWAEKTSQFIIDCGLPLMPLGMGSQALAGETNPNIGLPSFISELATVIGAHSKTIGVRGEFTQQVLNHIGVQNVTVIGCPSNFISSESRLGAKVKARFHSKEPSRICVSGNDFHVHRLGHDQIAERKLLDYLELHDAFYLVQAPEELVALTRADHRSVVSLERLEELRRYLRPSYNYSRFTEMIRRRFISLPHIESWLEFMSGCDLYVGMRIHGAMASIQAGTLPVCVTHDRRTEELCKTMKIPSLNIADFCEASDIFDVYSSVDFNDNEFDENRHRLGRIYSNIYQENGIKCHLPFALDNEILNTQ